MKESFTNTTVWQAPSNIALIKYWGKYGNQMAMNPSLSLTLSESITITQLTWERGLGEVSLNFEESESTLFQERIQKIFNHYSQEFECLKKFNFKIKSKNSFPHSCGIASSASAFAALSLCLNDFLISQGIDINLNKVSSLARLGSGSASRSVFGGINQWGQTQDGFGNNLYSTQYEKASPFFRTLNDAILIVSSGIKSVSSSAGHELMNDHPFRQARIAQAELELKNLKTVLEGDNWEDFARIVEREALTLHGLMMSSLESFILMEPLSLRLINLVRQARRDGIKVCFTLDAGPNLHVLFPEEEKDKVKKYLSEEIAPLIDSKIIYDRQGTGPMKRDKFE